jgi:ADP-heptose:LPS heptosyltransferase
MKITRDLYYISKPREERSNEIAYWFDKITSLFIRSKKGGKIQYPKKALLIRNDHIGDIVYATPVIREFKKAFPKCKVVVMASPGNKEIVKSDKYVDEIIEFGLFWREFSLKSWLNYFKILKKIRRERFDVGMDLRRSRHNMIFFLFLGGVRNRISYYNITGGKAFLTHPVLYEKRMNNFEGTQKLLEIVFGIKIKDKYPHIMISDSEKKEAYKIMREKGLKDYILIAPGATYLEKAWPEAKFSEFIEKFHKKYPKMKVAISGSRNDRPLIERVSRGRNYCVALINVDLRIMSVMFRNAHAVVANNGAATDITWPVGGRLVYLSGPVSLDLARPVKNTKIIHHDFEPLDPKKPYWGDIKKITVDEVMGAVGEFIKFGK